MTATATQIAELRRKVAEPTTATYSDAALKAYIERYPLMDVRGEEPHTWDTSTAPPSTVANTDWIATYDTNSAAADVWDEKAATLAQDFDFRSEGREFNRSQTYLQAQQRAMYYRSRRAMRTITARMYPSPKRVEVLIGNAAEDD